jgi:ABC-type iron transport system FetAB permease component
MAGFIAAIVVQFLVVLVVVVFAVWLIQDREHRLLDVARRPWVSLIAVAGTAVLSLVLHAGA